MGRDPERAGGDAAKQQTPAGTFADYAVTLLPWAAYIVGTNLIGSWKYGFIIGSGIAAGIVLLEIARRQSRFMDLGTLLFCLVMTGFALYNAKSFLKTYNLPLSLAFIGVLSAVSLLLGSPFTYRCHRDHLPKDVTEHSETNDVILRHHVQATTVWAVSELLAGGLSALMIVNHLSGFAVAAQAIGTLVPMGYTRFTHEKIHAHPTVRAHPAMAVA